VKRNDKDNTKISLGLNVKIISNATTYRPTGPTGILKFISVLGRHGRSPVDRVI